MSVIKTTNLKYIYGQGTPFQIEALKGIDISIEKGEFIGIIGHTGSGKSTLVQHFNGLIKPTSGDIFVDGQNIWDKPKEIRSVRFKVGLVFQYPEYQLFEQTVFKDIAFGPQNMGIGQSEIQLRVQNAMQLVGLHETYTEKSPFDLSGGEKRRVAIAGVMAMNPEVLVLDEPTAGLDPNGRNEILGQIKKYHEETGNTVIIVSHSMEDIAKMADRVLVMNKGLVEMFDTTEKVFSKSDRLMEIGLNVPQVTRIFMGLKSRGLTVDAGVYTMKQAKTALLDILSQRGNGNA